MANKKLVREFFDEDSLHGLIKRTMYKKYLQAYIPKTQNEKTKYAYKTIIIDAFAGRGRYKKESQYEWPAEIEKYGSPLIALMVALNFSHTRAKKKPDIIWTWEKSAIDPKNELKSLSKSKRAMFRNEDSCDIELIFIESNDKHCKELACNVEIMLIRFLEKYYPALSYGWEAVENEKHFSLNGPPFSINVRIINSDFEAFEPPFELTKSGVCSLTFLDPFGYTDTPMKNVKRFAPGQRNDILINVMSSYVNRQVKRNPKGVAALFGIDLEQNDDEVRENLSEFVESIIRSYKTSKTSKEELSLKRAKIIVNNYEEFLKRKTGTEFSLTFEMRKENNDILYHIIYITNHPEGVKAMKESMNRCSQVEDGMEMSEFYILRKGQKINLGNMDCPEKVAKTVFDNFKGQRNVAICKISDFVWFHTPYLYRTRPLGKLEKEGEVSVRHKVKSDNPHNRKRFTFPDKTEEGSPIRYYLTFAEEESSSSSNTIVETKKLKGAKSSEVKGLTTKKIMNTKESAETFANEKMEMKETFVNVTKSIENEREIRTDKDKRDWSEKYADMIMEMPERKTTVYRKSKEKDTKKKVKLKGKEKSEKCASGNVDIDGKLKSDRMKEKEMKKKRKLKRREDSEKCARGKVDIDGKLKSDRKKEKEIKKKKKMKRREYSKKCASDKVEINPTSTGKSDNKQVREKNITMQENTIEHKRKREISMSYKTNQKRPKLS